MLKIRHNKPLEKNVSRLEEMVAESTATAGI